MNRYPPPQQGMTLVELMVSITLGLMLSGAITALYLASNQTNRHTEAAGRMGDNARIAFDLIGRDLQMAGYYPSALPTAGSASATQIGTHPDAVTATGTPAAYSEGLFGCQGGFVDAATATCSGSGASSPDGLAVSYFSEDRYGAGGRVGLQGDCLGRDVATSATVYNQTRAAIPLPVQIINLYRLVPQSVSIDGGAAVSTQALACHGNGDPAGDYTAVASGIEDLQLTYGIRVAAAPGQIQFVDAGSVPAGQWGEVVAVKVCLIARSLETVRQADAGGANARTYEDCLGSTQTLSNSNRFLVRRFEQTYAIRNHLGANPWQ